MRARLVALVAAAILLGAPGASSAAAQGIGYPYYPGSGYAGWSYGVGPGFAAYPYGYAGYDYGAYPYSYPGYASGAYPYSYPGYGYPAAAYPGYQAISPSILTGATLPAMATGR